MENVVNIKKLNEIKNDYPSTWKWIQNKASFEHVTLGYVLNNWETYIDELMEKEDLDIAIKEVKEIYLQHLSGDERMKLKDILPDHYIDIQVRTYDPFGDDMLFGYCHWTGTELVSDDGDSYSIEEEIIKYEFNEFGLTYWFKGEWISGEDI